MTMLHMSVRCAPGEVRDVPQILRPGPNELCIPCRHVQRVSDRAGLGAQKMARLPGTGLNRQMQFCRGLDCLQLGHSAETWPWLRSTVCAVDLEISSADHFVKSSA